MSISAVHNKQAQGFSSAQHLVADIVLIDKQQDSLKPLLYQLRNEINASDLTVDSHGLVRLPHGAFTMLGEVISIDKKKKIVYLSNENSVGYRYLIIATHTKVNRTSSMREDEFCIGMHALLEGIKIQKNLPKSLVTPFGNFYYEAVRKIQNCTFLKVSVSSLRTSLPKNVEKVAQNSIPQEEEKPTSATLNANDKRVFEVQL